MKSSNIPQGYKLSPLGVIPQDWEVLPMKQIVRYVSGGAFSSKDATTTGVRWLKIANVGVNVIKWDEQSYLPTSLMTDYPQCELSQGDVVLALTRPILNGVLKISYIKESDTPALLNQRVAKLNELNGFSRRYIYYSMQTPRFVAQMESDMLGTDPPNASFESMYRQKITVPPLAEQERIAEVLGTWDEAIDKQSQLVKALERRKRALMQQLLTARIRLPNLSAPWHSVKFKDIFFKKHIKAIGNTYDVLSVTKDGIVSQKEYFTREVASEDTSKYLIVERGDLAMSGLNFWMGSCHILTGYENGIISPAYKVFGVSTNFNTQFIKYFVGTQVFNTALLGSSVTGASIVRRNLDKEMLEEWNFNLPSIEEQEAIAQILTTADKEIELATKKLETLRTQKRALMQQLLTGKKRLKI